LEQAEAICQASDAFEGIIALRRQSLLRVQTGPGSQQNRYLVLDSVREYAAEKLVEWPAAAEGLGERHARELLRFAEVRVAQLRTPVETRALAALASEFDNLRAAFRWTRN